MKKFKRKIVFLISCFLVQLVVAGIAWAGSPAGANTLTDATPQREDGFQVEFQGVGVVDRMGAGEIVIDDSLFRLSPSVSFFGEGGEPLGSGSFAVGTLVGYELEAERVIRSLWKLPAPRA
ncbi:MAG: hypothetical protein R6X05_11145, partial [Desulfobacterales bacterium]